jgi:antitoxin VapB
MAARTPGFLGHAAFWRFWENPANALASGTATLFIAWNDGLTTVIGRLGGHTLERSLCGRFVKAGQLDRLSSAAHRSAGTAFDICYGTRQIALVAERRVKLFKNRRNQAVRIPREFELRGEDAIIRQEGQRLVIEPAPPNRYLPFWQPFKRSMRNFRQSTIRRQSLLIFDEALLRRASSRSSSGGNSGFVRAALRC